MHIGKLFFGLLVGFTVGVVTTVVAVRKVAKRVQSNYNRNNYGN